MAKVKIQGNASGTGVLTIAAPNTSTDRTITLPDTTGTLLDENSSVPAANLTGTVADARISALTASKLTGALPAISGASLTNLPAASGTVKQVAQHLNSTETTISDGAWHETNTLTMSAPASSSSIYLIWAKVQMTCDNNEYGAYRLTRTDSGGMVVLWQTGNYLLDNSSGGGTIRQQSPMQWYLAAPNGLAQTFKLEATNSNGTVQVMEAGADNVMICQEIGAL